MGALCVSEQNLSLPGPVSHRYCNGTAINALKGRGDVQKGPGRSLFQAACLPSTASQGSSGRHRRKKRVYSAPPGKRAFVFVDDLNTPAKEKYGAQPPIELLQQWIDHGYWFDKCNKY
ncbi:dynein axonemal heavy chain 11-like [Melospiza melodia melodia]|uniref:dynein axonemal heavy chain 11-like n=1 Tax=Melospiza melodia melodia TaxID=1914991 RepID=UPI002FD2997D